MKLWQWLLLAAALYEGLVGLAEVSTLVASSNGFANTVVGWPSLGQSLYTTSVVSSIQIGGGFDLALSAILLWAAL